jgi:hypothetical protein
LAVVGSWDDTELAALIDEILVDAYGDAVQLTSFETSFEGGDERRGLRAVVAAAGVVQRMDLLDIDFDDSPEDAARLIAAYRRWWVPPG